MSDDPPGANVITTRIGFVGHDWPAAIVPHHAMQIAETNAALRANFMTCLPGLTAAIS
jgi:hypothetical protein